MSTLLPKVAVPFYILSIACGRAGSAPSSAACGAAQSRSLQPSKGTWGQLAVHPFLCSCDVDTYFLKCVFKIFANLLMCFFINVFFNYEVLRAFTYSECESFMRHML